MTQHLTRASRRYILQVSDRLVGGGTEDPLANKNVIFFARNGVVTIGYTGLAYELSTNRNMPTDEWIAETLRGQPIPRGRDGIRPVGSSGEKIAKWLDVGQSVELLRESAEKSIKRLPLSRRKFAFRIIVAGWQLRRKRFAPVVIEIIKPSGDASLHIEQQPRNVFLRQFALIDTPNISPSDLSKIGNDISKSSPDEAEALLVEAIRVISSKRPKQVGPHCMSILLPPPGSAPIRVRFIPATPHTGELVSHTNKTRQEVPVAFSPWVIGPKFLRSPSLFGGSHSFSIGPWEIDFQGPTPPPGIVGFFSASNRPKAPR